MITISDGIFYARSLQDQAVRIGELLAGFDELSKSRFKLFVEIVESNRIARKEPWHIFGTKIGLGHRMTATLLQREGQLKAGEILSIAVALGWTPSKMGKTHELLSRSQVDNHASATILRKHNSQRAQKVFGEDSTPRIISNNHVEDTSSISKYNRVKPIHPELVDATVGVEKTMAGPQYAKELVASCKDLHEVLSESGNVGLIKRFAEFVRQQRVTNNLTQSAVAEAGGLHAKAVMKIEYADKHMPPLSHLICIAIAFSWTPEGINNLRGRLLQRHNQSIGRANA